jgi:hypothetical protein
MMRPPLTVATCPDCGKTGVACCAVCGLCGEHLHDHPEDVSSVTNPGGSYDLAVVPGLAAGRQPPGHYWTDSHGWVLWCAP